MFGRRRQEKWEAKQNRIIDFLGANGPSTAYEIYENTRNQGSSRTDGLVFVVLADCVEMRIIRRIRFYPNQDELAGGPGTTFVDRYFQFVKYVEDAKQHPPTLFCLPDDALNQDEPGPDPAVSLGEACVDISVLELEGQIWLRN